MRQNVSEILTGRDLSGSAGSREPERRGQSWQRRSIPRLRPRARDARRVAAVVGARRRQRGAADGGAGRDRGEHRAPSAQRALAFSDADRQWVVTAYALAFGSLLLIGGKLSDCSAATAPSWPGWPGSPPRRRWPGLRRTSRSWPPRTCAAQGAFGRCSRRRRWRSSLATFAAARPAAARSRSSARSPGSPARPSCCLGGLLTEHLNWRWTLYVNLARCRHRADRGGSVPGAGTRRAIGLSTIDLPGTALVSAGLFLLVFGLSRARRLARARLLAVAGRRGCAARRFAGGRPAPPRRCCRCGCSPTATGLPRSSR